MLKVLLKSMREYKLSAFLAPFFVSLEVILEVTMPLVINMLINYLESVSKGATLLISRVAIYGAILFSMALVSLACGILSGIFAAKCASGFAKNIRNDLFKKTQLFSFENIDKFSVSSLVTRMTTDCTNIKMATEYIVRIAVRGPLMIIFALIMSFVVNWMFATIFLATAVVLGIGIFLCLYFALPHFRSAFRKYDALNNTIQENIKGIRVVKSFVREDYEQEKLKKASANMRHDFFNGEFIISFSTPMMQFSMYAMITVLLGLGSVLAVKSGGDAMSIGQIQALFMYAIQILSSLMMFSMVFVMISMSTESAIRCVEVLTEEPTITNPENPVYEVKDGSIEFDNVNFKYSEKAEKYSLENINLRIESGETVGVFGSTGSSKTSLVNLICRLYDTTEGQVKVGGVDVRDYDLTSLRDNVAIVLQKNVLFKGTIKENLRWGKEDATDEEIMEACKLSQAHDFIEQFPDKYDHMIEQGGTNVSGGQKQRLCIARALLKSPKILILDDSTSAVDTKTDALIRDAFKNKIPNTTKFIIGQRISSIQDSDKIIIMNDGHIEQIGTHDELLKTNKIYQEVYSSQLNVGGSKNA